jgi:hypothetical protein
MWAFVSAESMPDLARAVGARQAAIPIPVLALVYHSEQRYSDPPTRSVENATCY